MLFACKHHDCQERRDSTLRIFNHFAGQCSEENRAELTQARDEQLKEIDNACFRAHLPPCPENYPQWFQTFYALLVDPALGLQIEPLKAFIRTVQTIQLEVLTQLKATLCKTYKTIHTSYYKDWLESKQQYQKERQAIIDQYDKKHNETIDALRAIEYKAFLEGLNHPPTDEEYVAWAAEFQSKEAAEAQLQRPFLRQDLGKLQTEHRKIAIRIRQLHRKAQYYGLVELYENLLANKRLAQETDRDDAPHA